MSNVSTRYDVPPWIKADTIPAIFPAMSAAMKSIEAVTKSRKNQDQNYAFRGIDQVYNMIHGVLAEQGITTPPRVTKRETGERKSKSGATMTWVCLEVEFAFTASDGSSMIVGPICSEALDMSDKAHNKALAFAQKYALLQTFTIPTEDVAEGDRETLQAIPQETPVTQSTYVVQSVRRTTSGNELMSEVRHSVGAMTALPETIPEEITELPLAIMERNKQLRQFEGVPLKLLVTDDLDLCLETLKRSYDVRSKDGKTPEAALAWMRALIATLTILRAKSGTVAALDKFAEKAAAK